VIWVNGPVLNTAADFVSVAEETLSAGVPPTVLWIGARWNSDAQLLYTAGMSQFGSPEMFLRLEHGPSVEVRAYFFDLAVYILTTNKELREGETVDGPDGGALLIKSMKGTETGKKGILLTPLKPN
jgi:hypothetical protein